MTLIGPNRVPLRPGQFQLDQMQLIQMQLFQSQHVGHASKQGVDSGGKE